MRGCLLTIKRLAVVIGICVSFLASSQAASACQVCRRAGFVCGIDDCITVWTCTESHIGGGGQNDCDDSSSCSLSGGFCQWASKASPIGKDQDLTLTCHETKS